METLDFTGVACPVPVITTKKRLDALGAGARVEVIVDNPTAVANIENFASRSGHAVERGAVDGDLVHLTLTAGEQADAASENAGGGRQVKVVAVGTKTMGEGDERLGATLLKGFLYALTEQDRWPDTVLFYNGGAFLTAEASESLDDLETLANGGVEILTCGTCINHYGLPSQPAVGGVTNMYTIAELLLHADSVIKP